MDSAEKQLIDGAPSPRIGFCDDTEPPVCESCGFPGFRHKYDCPKKRHLRGDRNQCPACGKYFNSTHAFEKHRTGKFGENGQPATRRCMTAEEMLAKGMAQSVDPKGLRWWVSELMPQDDARRKPNKGEQHGSREPQT